MSETVWIARDGDGKAWMHRQEPTWSPNYQLWDGYAEFVPAELLSEASKVRIGECRQAVLEVEDGNE